MWGRHRRVIIPTGKWESVSGARCSLPVLKSSDMQGHVRLCEGGKGEL